MSLAQESITRPFEMLTMQTSEAPPSSSMGHRHTQSYAAKPSADRRQFPMHSHQPSVGNFADYQHRASIPNLNTAYSTAQQTSFASNDLASPETAYEHFTPLLPSQLLMGSPFQTGSPSTFQSPQYQTYSPFAQQARQQPTLNTSFQQQQTFPTNAYNLTSPTTMGSPAYFGSIQSPTTGFNALQGGAMGAYGAAIGITPGAMTGTSRTVYLGNIPPDTSAEEILSHVRSGQIESVRLLPEKNCAFISFLDAGSATHFHSDAILKKLSIKGQDIKVGWGKPSTVPTSVALAVQQSGASRNVYLGNLPEELSEAEIREELGRFGPIDTIKIVREKAIGFVHFLSIGNAVKAVTQLPQDPNWQPPRRVYYGKDRCAYVSKTQQQNAAQYLGIAPGYAHVLNGADRELITNALAQQSVAAAAVATSAGGATNLGNRTVYLGNIHPETTIEEICNVVRGGLLHHIRYIPDKHICFVTFIDPTSAASFYALSNLQGLMIHNRRLKIGWGKHSGALPPAIALAVSGGASRNVYVGNLDESCNEDRLRQDFSEYGEIELVNTLREKSCAFVNFTNIANAIKAIEAIRGKEEYKRFKINFGKDRCGNPPRQVSNTQPQHQQQQHYTYQQPQQPLREQQQSPATQLTENGTLSPSPLHNLQSTRVQNSISPASGASVNGSYNPLQGPTASTILNAGNNNPLTQYLAAAQQSAYLSQQGQADSTLSAFSSLGANMPTQSAFYSSPNETAGTRSAGLELPSAGSHFGHSSHQSVNLANGHMPLGMYSSQASQQAQRASHNRAFSLPAFNLQQAQQAGLANSLAGLGVTSEGTLPGWAEEEVA